MKTHLVNVSGGAASAVCLLRVIERYGRDNVRAVFADTRIEDPSLYRFLDDLGRVAGVEIQKLSDGRSAWDVFEAEAMWTNPQTGGCLASYHLKKIPLRRYRESLGLTPETCVNYVGFDASERDRMERIAKADAPWQFDFPLSWKPVLLRCDQLDYLESRGLVPCDMYERGYSHANCGGTCVLAGLKQWAMVYQDYPERFKKAVAVESEVLKKQAERNRDHYTILRRTTKGIARDVALPQLAAMVDSGDVLPTDARQSSCSCIGLLFDMQEPYQRPERLEKEAGK